MEAHPKPARKTPAMTTFNAAEKITTVVPIATRLSAPITNGPSERDSKTSGGKPRVEKHRRERGHICDSVCDATRVLRGPHANTRFHADIHEKQRCERDGHSASDEEGCGSRGVDGLFVFFGAESRKQKRKRQQPSENCVAEEQAGQSIVCQCHGDQRRAGHCSRSPSKIEQVEQGSTASTTGFRNVQIRSWRDQPVAQAEGRGSRQRIPVRAGIEGG